MGERFTFRIPFFGSSTPLRLQKRNCPLIIIDPIPNVMSPVVMMLQQQMKFLSSMISYQNCDRFNKLKIHERIICDSL